MISNRNEVGASSGKVIERKRRHAPAPSTVAASNRLAGIDCSPARYTTMQKPIRTQTVVMISDGSAHASEDVHGTRGRPSFSNRPLITPCVVSYIHAHTSATTTPAMTTGTK